MSNLKALLLGVGTSLLLVLAFFNIALDIKQGGPVKIDLFTGSLVTSDGPNTVPRHHAGDHTHHQMKVDEKIIYDVDYDFDEFGRRLVPGNSSENPFHLALFGGSYTFGYGLQEVDTTSGMLKRALQKFNVYNYGEPGAGTNSVLSLLEGGRPGHEIQEKRGYGVYLFLEDHFNRLIGSSYWVANSKNAPFYRFDSNHHVIRDGTFLTGRPELSKFYLWWESTWVSSYFNIHFPLWTGPEEHDLLCESISKISREYSLQFPVGRFVVVLLPQLTEIKSELKEIVRTCLGERNISILSLDAEFLTASKDEEMFLHRLDPHPNRKYNKLIVKKILQFIEANPL